jgi:hypothetical protein
MVLGTLTAETARSTIFWVVTPCSLVEVQQRFGVAYRVHAQGGRENQAGREQEEQADCCVGFCGLLSVQ